MGINADFLIKHVRPYGMEAHELVCAPTGAGSLRQWLLTSGVLETEIDAAFNSWAALALVDINEPANLNVFIGAAEAVSHARWEEYYATSASTILFLNDQLIRELSAVSEANIGEEFDFDPHETIPLAVTINAHDYTAQTTRGCSGASLASDGSGNCCHFAGLIA